MVLRDLPEFWLPAVSSKRRLHVATAIYGQEGGLPALDADSCSSYLFLCVRIYLYLSVCFGMTLMPPAQPSGLVPDWCRGVAAQFVVGRKLGLDCVFAIFTRVLYAKIQDLVVISFLG
jgi:hypothetical protein